MTTHCCNLASRLSKDILRDKYKYITQKCYIQSITWNFWQQSDRSLNSTTNFEITILKEDYEKGGDFTCVFSCFFMMNNKRHGTFLFYFFPTLKITRMSSLPSVVLLEDSLEGQEVQFVSFLSPSLKQLGTMFRL